MKGVLIAHFAANRVATEGSRDGDNLTGLRPPDTSLVKLAPIDTSACGISACHNRAPLHTPQTMVDKCGGGPDSSLHRLPLHSETLSKDNCHVGRCSRKDRILVSEIK